MCPREDSAVVKSGVETGEATDWKCRKPVLSSTYVVRVPLSDVVDTEYPRMLTGQFSIGRPCVTIEHGHIATCTSPGPLEVIIGPNTTTYDVHDWF